MLWLPTYAAHRANPVERIWGLLKDAVAADRLEGDLTADRLEGDLTALVAHIRRFCAELAPYPVKPPVAA